MTDPVSRTGATDREVEAPSDELVAEVHQYIADRAAVWESQFAAGPGDVVGLPDAARIAAHWHLARAAAAPDSGQLREFAEFVVSLDDDDPESPGRQARRTVTLAQLVDRARAALLAEQPGGGA